MYVNNDKDLGNKQKRFVERAEVTNMPYILYTTNERTELSIYNTYNFRSKILYKV